MEFTNNDKSSDKLAVAQEVIVSAGNILVAAGFARAEIAAFFRQAADHLEPGDTAAPRNEPEIAVAEGSGAQDLISRFQTIDPVRLLTQIAASAPNSGNLAGQAEALKDSFDLAMKMVPHIAEAQDWLRTAATEAGLPIAASRAAWRQTADSGELANEAGYLFLDEFERAYEPGLALIGAVTDALIEQGDEQAFFLMLVSLVDHNISVSRDLKEAMEAGVNHFKGPSGAS